MPPKTNLSFALTREFTRVSTAWVSNVSYKIPRRWMLSVLNDPVIDSAHNEARLLDLVGEGLLGLFDDLGPVYGKAGQIALSRLSPRMQHIAETIRLTRLYGDWPPIDFSEIEAILDREIPEWRGELKIDSVPLGVASLAQAHGATDKEGRKWVIKILKPHASLRLRESVAALRKSVRMVKPLALAQTFKRVLSELEELCDGLERELDFKKEAETIVRVKAGLKDRKQQLLRIPDVYERFSTKSVLTIERFEGTAISEIVANKKKILPLQRKKLAKHMLQELLIQVFEIGLFHADPHAGNLILLDDGSVGLFDWGLAGELRERDRKHISAMLKAVLARDMERLAAVLIEMGQDGGKKVSDKKVKRELSKIASRVKEGVSDPTKKPSLQELIELCLKAANRLRIPIPSGLLLMAKSLITIEGLARGIDPEISMARIAGPILFKAVKPGVSDLFLFMKRIWKK